MPIIVSPTPVVIKPALESNHPLEVTLPKNGGKIRLPAPNNMEKRAKPNIITSLLFLLIIHSLTYTKSM